MWFGCCWAIPKPTSIHLPRGHHLDSCFEMCVRDEEKVLDCVSLQSETHIPNYTQRTHTRRACKEEITMSAALLQLCAGVSNLHKKACECLCVSAGLISTVNVLDPAPWLGEAECAICSYAHRLASKQIGRSIRCVQAQLLLALSVRERSCLKSAAEIKRQLWSRICWNSCMYEPRQIPLRYSNLFKKMCNVKIINRTKSHLKCLD